MKKKLLVILLSIILVLSLSLTTACNSDKDDSGDQVTITFWKGPFSDYETELWQPTIDRFEEQNPGIKVDFLDTPWESWLEKYTSAFASGSPPDVSFMVEWYPQFAEAGQLVDLSSLITDEMRDRYSEKDWDYCTYDGKVVGIPYTLGVSVVFYHKDIFEKEGITELPQDWDSFREVCKKLTHDDQWALKFVGFPDINIHQYMPYIIQSGAEYLNEDQTASGFDNPEGVRGLEFVTGLITKDKVAPPLDMYSDDQLDDMFYNGQIAMCMDGIEYYADLMDANPDADIGAFLWPQGPAEDEIAARANYGAVSLLSIAEDSPHQEEAWKFIEFLTEPENEQLYVKAVNMLSPNPATNELMYQDNEVMDVAIEASKYYVNYPVNVNWGEIDSILFNMLEKILREDSTVKKAVSDANTKIKDALQ